MSSIVLERRRQRDSLLLRHAGLGVVRAHAARREQRHRHRLVAPDQIAVAVVLPVETDAHTMRGRLPDDGVGEVKPACQVVRRDCVAYHQTGLCNGDRRLSKPQAPRTVLFTGAATARADDEGRKPQVVDERRPKHAGERHQTLIRVGDDAVPVRRVRVWRTAADRGSGRPKRAAAVVRVARKERMAVADFHIESCGEQVADQRAAGDAAQMGEVRHQQRRAGHRVLIVALPAAEVEDAIAADRATGREAELLPLEERLRIVRVADERWIGRQVVVAEEIEEGALRLVAAAPRDDVDRSGVGHAGREVEIHRRYLEFLKPFLREPHLRAAERHRGDAASIHGEARTADVGGGRAEHREDRAIAIGSGRLLHTGLELAEVEEVAPVQWQPLDLIAADRTADGGRIEPELRRRRLDPH